MGIRLVDPIDLFSLSRAQVLARIQTPDSIQQPLPPQNLVQAGDTTGERVPRVEKSRVSVRYFDVPLKQILRNAPPVTRNGLTLLQQTYGSPRPYRPVAQEASYDAPLLLPSIDPEGKG